MEDLKKEYIILFNGITDTVRQLEKTVGRLRHLQQRAEELYIEESQDEAEDEALEMNTDSCAQ